MLRPYKHQHTKERTTVGEGAFSECYNLETITVAADNPNYKDIDGNLYSKDATVLLQYAYGKTDDSFTIPSCVTTIGDRAFYGCISFDSIIIPENVTTIGYGAFSYCEYIKAFTVASDNPNYKDINGDLYSKDGTVLVQYAMGKTDTSYTILDSVTTIGEEAFYGGNRLECITIPISVKTIGEGALSGCEALTTIKYEGTEQQWEEVDIFWSDFGLNWLNIVYEATSAAENEIQVVSCGYDSGKVSAEIEIKNLCDAGDLMLAIYDSSDRLISVEKKPVALGSSEAFVEAAVSGSPDGLKAKVFYIDVANTLKPLSNSLDVDITNEHKGMPANIKAVSCRYESGKVSAAVTFDYLLEKGALVLAIYDSNGKLISSGKESVALGSSEASVEAAVSGSFNGLTAKVFYIDIANTLKPLAKSVDAVITAVN